jgi:hypothetical protein
VISPVPQIEQFRLESNWEFLVVATDGVWDAMSNADILKYLASRLDNKNRYRDKNCTRYRDLPKYKDSGCPRYRGLPKCKDRGCNGTATKRSITQRLCHLT